MTDRDRLRGTPGRSGSLMVLLLTMLGVLAFVTTLGSAQVNSTMGSTAQQAILGADPNQITFTLEGCRNIGGIVLPNANGDFICADGDYTTGNLGKGWNELDLVPHRVTLKNGDGDQTYTFIVAGDYKNGSGTGTGWDVISELKLNAAKSTASCPVTPTMGPLTITLPGGGVGGADQTIYRTVTLQQKAGTTCVYDYYQRLALGAHNFSGSSLQSNLWNQNLSSNGIGQKRLSLPVGEILPQELSKDMTATQGTDHVWNITKAPTPATVSFADTCSKDGAKTAGVQIKVTWEKQAADPSGPITVITHVYAKNPAARTITVNVTDVIYSGTTALDTSPTVTVDVPANTTQLVLTHTFVAPEGTTDLNDIATATYTDKVTGVPVPGKTTATASATVQLTGPELNKTATIKDVESITGSGLSYSVDSFMPAIGAFDGGYVAGTKTPGSVSWTSTSQSDSGSVTFNKTVYVDAGVSTTGTLDDTATVTGSDGFTAEAKGTVDISASAKATLTIEKTIPNVLQGAETSTFNFAVKDANNNIVATPSLSFTAGETSKSVSIGNLTPGKYTVSESTPSGFKQLDPIEVDLSGTVCAGTAKFVNVAAPAAAKVQKVTVPAGFEKGWTFDLKDGNGTTLETVTTTGAGFVDFATPLGEGSYQVVETTQPGWTGDEGSGCSLTVNLPGDADKVFACTFTNTYKPSVELTKTGDELSKIGDLAQYTIALENTSLSGGAAGAPALACNITDPTIGFSKDVTLSAGASDESKPTFTIPVGASDPFVNVAKASCTYEGLSNVVATDQASWSTNLFQPSIDVTKEGPALGKVGDKVTYKVTIANTSSTDSPDLVLDGFSDSLVAAVTPPAACSPLASGASCSFSYEYTVFAGDPDPLKNTASVHYHPAGFTNDISDQASWETNLFEPSIKLVKSGPELSKIGDKVDYTIVLSNTSSPDTPDLTCSVTDAKAGLNETGIVLGSGGEKQLAVSGFEIPAGAADPFVNTATATCSPTGFPNVLTETASHSINLFQPKVGLTKTADHAFSKAGDTVKYTVTITNASSADSPALVLDSFSDDVVGTVPPPAACSPLVYGAGCSFSYEYTVKAGDPDPLVNTAAVHYKPLGFPNDIAATGKATVDLLHPAFAVTKDCKVNTEPIPQAGPAVFTITFENTGDADLHFEPSEGTALDVGAGATKSYEYTVNGPFAGQATADNTVTGTATLSARYGLSNSYPFTATGKCTVAGKAKVVKTLQGGAITQPQGSGYTFQLRQGASTISDGSILETQEAYAGHETLAFTADLVPGNHYQLCEIVMPGWNTNLSYPGSTLFVPASVVPPSLPNPNVNNMTVCVDFTATAGGTTTFAVDNSPPPGGRALTIGFWKNWASCARSGGNQKPMLDKALYDAAQNGTPITIGILTLMGNDPANAADCGIAVSILNKADYESGKKMASDPLYNLAAQLLAAKLNLAEGAYTCGPVVTAINQADALLGKYNFDDAGPYKLKGTADGNLANQVAQRLDDYNNNRPAACQ